MIDILVYLFANYHDFSARPKTKTLKRKLSAVGFKAEAISMALHWLDGLKAATVVDLPASRDALRIYREQEQRKLGVDCLGFIAFLEAADLMAPALRELVIDRAMTLDDDHVPLGKVQDHRPDGSLESRAGSRAPDRRGTCLTTATHELPLLSARLRHKSSRPPRSPGTTRCCAALLAKRGRVLLSWPTGISRDSPFCHSPG
jgi:Smg protein